MPSPDPKPKISIGISFSISPFQFGLVPEPRRDKQLQAIGMFLDPGTETYEGTGSKAFHDTACQMCKGWAETIPTSRGYYAHYYEIYLEVSA